MEAFEASRATLELFENWGKEGDPHPNIGALMITLYYLGLPYHNSSITL